jgi:hypothetical protein
MIELQGLSYQQLVQASSATAAATITSRNYDSLGPNTNAKHDYCTIVVLGTTTDTTTDQPTVLKVQECDTTVASSFADITAFVGGTATSTSVGYVIPAGRTATAINVIAVFNINMIRRKRYLRVLISPATTQTFSVLAIGSRFHQSNENTANSGADALIQG